MSQKTLREKIVALKNASVSDTMVIEQLNVCRETVFNVMKRYKETGKTVSKYIPGQSRSFHTKCVAQAI